MKILNLALLAAIAAFTVQSFGATTATLDPSFNSSPGPDGMVEEIVPLPDGKILISGAFAQVGNEAHNYIARLNADGSVDSNFVTQANNWVRCMAVQPDGKILIGGKFTSVNGARRERIARLNADGTLDPTFDPGDGVQEPFYPTVPTDIPFVWDITPQPDGKILICGGFLKYAGVSRSCVARLNADGSLDTTFDPGAGAYKWVKSIYLLDDGKIMIAGWFENYDNQVCPRIARILSDGKIDPSFNPVKWGPSSSVYVLGFQPDGKFLACGHFSSVNDSAHEKLVRFNADGSVDETFNASADDFVQDLKLRSDGKILISGYFSNINGTSRRRLALLNPDGSVDPELAVPIDEYVWTLQQQNDQKLLIGGAFSIVDGEPRSRIARLNMAGVALPEIPSTSTNVVYFQNSKGEIAFSLLSSNLALSNVLTGRVAKVGWRAVAAGDFNHDALTDFVGINNKGQAALWLLNQTNFTESPLQNWPGAKRGWRFVGAGDFDTNGTSDLVWQKPRGQIEIWLLEGTNVLSSVSITNTMKAGWQALAVGDLNSDQRADIVWQRGENLTAWIMEGTTVSTNVPVAHPTVRLRGARALSVSDLNGDGNGDLLLQQGNARLTALYLNNLSSTNSATYQNSRVTRGGWRAFATKP